MTAEIRTSLNRLAGTTAFDAQGAANIWAGTTGFDLLGALNVRAGTTGLGLNGVCNRLAGTTGLEAQDALDSHAFGGPAADRDTWLTVTQSWALQTETWSAI